MRIGPIGENLRERLAVLLRLGPRPLLETHATLLLAQSVMVATKLGVFDALAGEPATAAAVASRCGTDERATERLLGVLRASGYLRTVAGGRFTLTADARRWLLGDGALSLRDNVLFRFVEWEWIGGLDRFVSSGRPIDIHAEMSPDEWGSYQRGMRSLARTLVREVARRTPVPRGATAMLDVGGAHGLFSAALCRRHRRLRATVLDLPEAVGFESARPEFEDVGDRIVFRTGDARTEDLGSEAFDLILIANLLHHLSADESRDLVRRAANALRPGGRLVVQELFALPPGAPVGQVAALADLYFALTSRSGTLSTADVALWLREAGLKSGKTVRFVTFPGAGQHTAVKRQ